MAKKHRSANRPGETGPLTKYSLLLPSTLSEQMQHEVLFQVRQLSTRCRIRREPGQRPILEAWCTPRQAHRFDTFSRSVFQAERRDEGYDREALKQYFEELSQEQPDDSFIFPGDTERLRIQAAATGMQSAMLDHPAYRSDDELHTIAARICTLGQELWSKLTNDMEQYRALFIPAFVLGYHLGVQQLALMTPERQQELTETVLDHQFNGNGPGSLFVFADLIRERMKTLGIERIDQLW